MSAELKLQLDQPRLCETAEHAQGAEWPTLVYFLTSS